MTTAKTAWKINGFLALGLLLAAFLLAACGGEPKEDVVLRLNLEGEPRSLDPALATDTASLDIAGSLFIGLNVERIRNTRRN